jgi:hypothetical protein
MVGRTDVAGLAGDLLKPGEEVLAAVRVNWNGMVPPTQAGVAGGLAGLGVPEGIAASAPSGPPDPDTLVAFPSAKQLGLILTGARLIVWALSFSGKPRQLAGEVPLTAIAEARLRPVRLGGVLRIVMRSGAVVELESVKGEPIDAFFEQLDHLLG